MVAAFCHILVRGIEGRNIFVTMKMAMAKFLNMAHSAASLAIRQAEKKRMKPIVAKLLLALRP